MSELTILNSLDVTEPASAFVTPVPSTSTALEFSPNNDTLITDLLMCAHRVSNRMLLSARSVEITSEHLSFIDWSPSATTAKSGSDKSLELYHRMVKLEQDQEVFVRSSPLTIVLMVDTGGPDAYVSSDVPDRIHLSLELVTSAIAARQHHGVPSDTYAYHLYHLAVVLAHEKQHLMRWFCNGIIDDTPKRLSMRYMFEGPDGTVRKWAGAPEGGWLWELRYFGGTVTRLMVPVTEARYPSEVEGLILEYDVDGYRQEVEYQLIPLERIRAVVEEHEGWEDTIVLPVRDFGIVQGVHPRAKPRLDVSAWTSAATPPSKPSRPSSPCDRRRLNVKPWVCGTHAARLRLAEQEKDRSA